MQLNKESLTEQISQRIKERIVNVEIEPGEKINLSELEEKFGVSRAPVREALQRMADQGLVKVEPRVGYFAVELTPTQIRNISEMRKLLETFALEKSINKVPEQELKSLMTRTEELLKNDLPQEKLRADFDSTDEELHSMLVDNSGNELLIDFTKRIHNLISLTRHLNERIDLALKEHEEILEFLIKRDQKEAKNALRKHLDNVEEEILANYSARKEA